MLVARGSVRTSECSNTFGNTASICVNRLGFFIDLADGRAAATSVVTAVVCCCCWELFWVLRLRNFPRFFLRLPFVVLAISFSLIVPSPAPC